MEGGEEGVVVCGCNRPVNVNDTDPRRRVRSAKPSRKPRPGTPIDRPSPTAAPRCAPGPRLVLALGRPRLGESRPQRPCQRMASSLQGGFCTPRGWAGVMPTTIIPPLARAPPRFMRLAQFPPQVHVTAIIAASTRVEPCVRLVRDPQPQSVA